MAVKKGVFDSYTKQREVPEHKKRAKYTHNKVFTPYEEISNRTQDNTLQKYHDVNQHTENMPKSTKSDTYSNTNRTQKHTHQTPDSDTYMAQMKHNISTKSNTKSDTYSNTNIEFNNTQHITTATLSGIQKRLFIVLYDNYIANGGGTTDRLSLKNISELSGVRLSSVKNSLTRLKKNDFIQLVQFKQGRHGWSIYYIPQYRLNEYAQYLKVVNKNKHDTNSYTNSYTKPHTNETSSSSFYINNKTTTKYENNHIKLNLSELLSILSKYHEVVNQKTIMNCLNKFESPLSEEEIQQSIDHFTFGLKNYPKHKRYNRSTKIATLLDCLKSNQIFIEPNYISKDLLNIYQIYEKARLKFDGVDNKNKLFSEWFQKDQETRKEKYRSKMASNMYLDDHTFMDISKQEFHNEIWPKMVDDYLSFISDDKEMLDKFSKIYTEQKQND